MPNIRKSFSFRDGVQVDDDDFIVRGNLVGIGTTIPTEKLDVKGNVAVAGLVTATELNVTGVSTFAEVKLGAGINMTSSGVITATSFKGDGSTLSNLPTSQWTDVNIGAGVTSIYNSGSVGVGTTDPVYQLQVGKSPDTSTGVGIDSTGNIKATGVVTATTFSGPLTGNVTGDLTGNVTASTLNVTGVSTFAGISTFNGEVGYSTHVSFGDYVKTSWGNHGDLEIWSNGNGSSYIQDTIGIGNIHLDGNFVVRNTAGNALSAVFTQGASVSLYYNNVKRLETSGIGITVSDQLDVTGNANFSGNIDVDGLAELDDVNVAGACTITGNARIGDVLLSNTNTRIGIGANPLSDLQIQKTTESAIVLGRSQAITGTNASIRFGTTNASFPYSAHTPESLDIINYGKGNVNFYLEAGVAGVGTGGFFWHRRSSFDQLMSLTYDAKLGIGVTVPDNTLHVVGTSTITDNAWFGNNVTIKQNLTVAGTTTLGAVTITNISSDVVGNVYAASGISTFKNLETDGWVEFGNVNGLSGVGIGTTASGNALTVGSQPATGGQSFMTGGGNLCLNNAAIMPGINLDARDSRATFKVIGVGATNPDAGADFGNCGYTTSRHMILPKVTTTERGNLNAVTNGSIIYNTSTNKFQGRANGAWVDLH